MNAASYTEIVFNNISEEQSSLLIALLSDCAVEGFEEDADILKAYAYEKNFDVQAVDAVAKRLSVRYTIQRIPAQNWNAVWEENFEPVQIENFALVRAHFHQPVAGVQHDIIITPKMSFGTGHHATTYLMIEQMSKLYFTGKQVLDFGTGTGVLAILAEKLGASSVTAIDNDEWSITNAQENIEHNNCRRIGLLRADNADVDAVFNIIAANINKNIILANMNNLAQQLSRNGYLLLSGLLAEDEQDIIDAATKLSLKHIHTKERGQWILLLLSS